MKYYLDRNSLRQMMVGECLRVFRSRAAEESFRVAGERDSIAFSEAKRRCETIDVKLPDRVLSLPSQDCEAPSIIFSTRWGKAFEDTAVVESYDIKPPTVDGPIDSQVWGWCGEYTRLDDRGCIEGRVVCDREKYYDVVSLVGAMTPSGFLAALNCRHIDYDWQIFFVPAMGSQFWCLKNTLPGYPGPLNPSLPYAGTPMFFEKF